MNCAGEQQAVNKVACYFGARSGSRAFQPMLKGCFLNFSIGSASWDKRKEPRSLCEEIMHTEQTGSSARAVGIATVSKIQTHEGHKLGLVV